MPGRRRLKPCVNDKSMNFQPDIWVDVLWQKKILFQSHKSRIVGTATCVSILCSTCPCRCLTQRKLLKHNSFQFLVAKNKYIFAYTHCTLQVWDRIMEETYLIALQYDETKLVTSRNEEIVLDISDLNGASRWSD